MNNPLYTKLSSFSDLTEDDRMALNAIGSNGRPFKAGHDLIKEGSRPENVFLLLDGWACRYKILPDGSRQIVAYLIPGDLCDIHIFILKQMDHGIRLLGNATAAAIPKQVMLDLLDTRPRIAKALFWSTLVDEAILREWLLNVGQRDAFGRIAHLFCEMWLRMNQVGLVTGDTFSMPVTQEEIGDTVGLTSVHTNRMLQQMRAENLISMSGGKLTIHDIGRLQRAAGFDANYLHLDRRT